MTCSNLSNRKNTLLICLLFCSLLMLQGCGSRKPITISSQPQGADIIADGKNIGKTPMQVEQDEVFPPRWHGTSYMVKGKLEIQKEGCDPVKMNVDDLALSKNINADLNCRQGITTAPAKTSAPATVAPVMEKPASMSGKPETKATEAAAPVDDIEKRLGRLKELRDRGVITPKEYAAQRKRILDSL